MAPPAWLRVKLKLLLENYATPALCALGVALYQGATLQWPVIGTIAASIGIDPVAVNAAIIALMAALANMLDRRWGPMFQDTMSKPEAVAEVKAEQKTEAKAAEK